MRSVAICWAVLFAFFCSNAVQAELVYHRNAEPRYGSGSDNAEEEVLRIVNEERMRHGLNPLEVNARLAQVARYKAEDIRDNDYFGHHSPIFGSPFDMLDMFDIGFRKAGENLALGHTTAQHAMEDWMASEGHRSNILGSYTEIGIAALEGPRGKIWVKMFIAP